MLSAREDVFAQMMVCGIYPEYSPCAVTGEAAGTAAAMTTDLGNCLMKD